MRTLIEKEIRLLLPAFVGALVLAIVPVWLAPYDHWNPSAIPNYLYLFGALLLALSSFGREIGLKTLPFILAQPLDRARIWWTKISVLAVFLALGFDAWWLSDSLCSIHRPALLLPPDAMAIFGLFAAVFAAGGLWMTLLLRQTVAAFWLTLLIPMAMLSAIKMIIADADWIIFAALGLYTVGGFFMARRQFLHMQDTAWTGGVLSFGGAAAASKTSVLRERRPWAALLRKELQLQQVTLMGMAGLLVLHLGVLMVRKIGAQVLGKSILSALEMFGWLWLIVPLLVGAQSVADERQLGTLDGLLGLPFSRRIQFAVKLITVLVLGGLLGAALLYAAEGVGGALGVGAKMDVMGINFHEHGIVPVAFIFLLLSLFGFYASTLTRGMVPALAAGTVVSILIWMMNEIASRFSYILGGDLWHLVAFPTLIATLIWLAFGNFRYVFESQRCWRRNILGLITVLIMINGSVAAVYHRVWELAMPLEGTHGPARLPPRNVLLRTGYSDSRDGTFVALLHDGRLWQGQINQQTGWPDPLGNHFVPGSNWVAAIALSEETAAIRTDGTLWVSERPQRPQVAHDPAPLVQFGAEAGWQSLARDSISMVILLKKDGSLWRLEQNSVTAKAYHGLLTLSPHRLGPESNWARILSGARWVYTWKQDGTAWHLQEVESGKEGSPLNNFHVLLDPMTAANRLPELDHTRFQSLNMSPAFNGINLGVRDDNTLWYWDWDGHKVRQIGHDSNWAAATSGFYQLVALKTDGSIWEWSFDPRKREMVERLQDAPVQVGTHFDWVGLGAWWDETVTLAADGTLFLWPKRNLPPPWGDDFGLWLAPSRRPAKIENILGAGQ